MHEPARKDDESILIKAVKQSDAEAFKKLCQKHYEAMYRFLWYKTRNRESAKDLVQELFLRLWQHRERLNEHLSCKAYLYRAANNLAIDHLREKAVRQAHSVDGPTARTLSVSDPALEFKEHLDDALQDLPEDWRLVFVMNRFEGLKYAEIAAALGISIKTVESWMSKALKVLREKFEPLLALILYLLLRS